MPGTEPFNVFSAGCVANFGVGCWTNFGGYPQGHG